MTKKYEASEKGKARRRRYEQSEKGKARLRRYQRSEKGKARWLKYSRSEKGQTSDRRQVWIGDHKGGRYLGKAETVEQADLIKAHIKERLRAFKQGQSPDPGMEVNPPDTVPATTGA